MTWKLELVPDYSRLDSDAKMLIEAEKEEFKTLSGAQKTLKKINAKLAARIRGKRDFIPRIDIVSDTGKRLKWGQI